MTQAEYVPVVSHNRVQANVFFQNVLAAIASMNAGPEEPVQTFAHMLWHDTTAGYLKQRNAANSGWNRLVAVPAALAQSAWDAGDASEESVISPAKLKAAITKLSPATGVGQTWKNVPSTLNTIYQNTTDKPIHVLLQGLNFTFQVSTDLFSTAVSLIGSGGSGFDRPVSVKIPPGTYYRALNDGGGSIALWSELS